MAFLPQRQQQADRFVARQESERNHRYANMMVNPANGPKNAFLAVSDEFPRNSTRAAFHLEFMAMAMKQFIRRLENFSYALPQEELYATMMRFIDENGIAYIDQEHTIPVGKVNLQEKFMHFVQKDLERVRLNKYKAWMFNQVTTMRESPNANLEWFKTKFPEYYKEFWQGVLGEMEDIKKMAFLNIFGVNSQKDMEYIYNTIYQTSFTTTPEEASEPVLPGPYSYNVLQGGRTNLPPGEDSGVVQPPLLANVSFIRDPNQNEDEE